MRKKILSLLMVLVMTGLCATSCAKPESSSKDGVNASGSADGVESGNQNSPVKEESSSSGEQLELFRTDLKYSQDQLKSRLKAEYLIENGGYSDNDEVVAIITMSEKSLIDTFNDGDVTANDKKVADYAQSFAGGIQAKRISDRQDILINSLINKGLIYSAEYKYSTVINAVAVNTTYGNLKKIEAFNGVEGVYLSDEYNRPAAVESNSGNVVENLVDVFTETGIFKSDSVEYTGQGTAVAVLDSGFDMSHEVFNVELHKDKFAPLINKDDITDALNGTGDNLMNSKYNTPSLKLEDVWYSEKIPYAYDYADKDDDVFPYDSEHGTHVAGIIGGGEIEDANYHENKIDVTHFRGVAVDTQLVLMKVFPDLTQGAHTEDLLAALEDSVLLGVDCINMSLGTSCGFSREQDNSLDASGKVLGKVINAVYDSVSAAGISLITAASNDHNSAYGGEGGNTNLVTNPDSATVGSPSTYRGSLSVASISGVKRGYLIGNPSTDNQTVFFTESNSIAGDQNNFVDELYAQQFPGDDGEHIIDYVTVPGYGLRVNYSGISSLIKGKVALVRRGENSFEEKAQLAKAAGAIAIIIYNNIDGDISMSMGKSDHIPAISISKDSGEQLASKATGKIKISKSQKAGPFMSDFSSWGPTPDLGIKPEITAHGGEITSSVPGGGYAKLSGTSMASPNMCGIFVIIKQYIKGAYPELNAKQIDMLANQLLMSTATIALNEEGNPYSPRKQGAGLASLKKAVTTKAYLSVDDEKNFNRPKLELGDDKERKGEYTMTFNLVNLSDTAMTYDLSVAGMTETVSKYDNKRIAEKGTMFKDAKTAVTVAGDGSANGTKVTVSAGKGKTAKITVKYTLAQADKDMMDKLFPFGIFMEGFVKLTAEDGNEVSLNIPFLAFYGDWTQAPLFDKTFYEVEAEAHDGSLDEDEKLKADYYATTPYGTYLFNYIIPLGSYLYDVPDGYDEIPASEDHISISGSWGSVEGITAIYAGLLRNAREVVYTITDKVTGEVVWTDTDANAHKAHSNGANPIPNYNQLNLKMGTAEDAIDADHFSEQSTYLGLINNRQYEFKMVATLDYGDGGLNTNARNTFDFDFYMDDEAPVIRSAVYESEYNKTEKKWHYYVNLTVSDNHCVQSVNPMIVTKFTEDDFDYTSVFDTAIPVVDSKRGQDNKVRIEITEILKDMPVAELMNHCLAFSVDDYAMNTNIYFCNLPGLRGEFKFTSDGTMDKTPLSYINVHEGEVVDLTKYLATGDTTVEQGRDYFKYLSWQSSNTSAATVADGLLVGKKAGLTTTVTVSETYSKGLAQIFTNMPNQAKSASLVIRVVAGDGASDPDNTTDRELTDISKGKIESVRFDYFDTIATHVSANEYNPLGEQGIRRFVNAYDAPIEIYPGESIQLHYDLQPWYMRDKSVGTYKSTNEKVCTVDRNGVVKALEKGRASITVEFEGSRMSATFQIVVKDPFIIENRMLVAYKGVGGDVVIPDDEGILYIGPYAFCLYTVDRTVELTEDDYDANKTPGTNDTVTSVTVPYGVMEIQKYAFANCTALKSVTLLGNSSGAHSNVKFIKDHAFYGDSKLETINLEHVEAVGEYCFTGCSALTQVDLSKCYTIGTQGFAGSGLTSVNLTHLRNTGVGAFKDCASLASVTLGEHTKLSKYMFENSALTAVTVLEKVTIPSGCFAGCKKLAEVTLPNNDIIIGDDVFNGCEKLATVKLLQNTNITNLGGGVFAGTGVKTFTATDSANYKISDDGALLLNKAGDMVVLAAPAFAFGDYTLPAEITAIANGAFSGADITSLTINTTNVTINDYAFALCKKLKSVTFAEGATIGNYAFFKNGALTTLNSLDKVTEIGEGAFAQTGELTGVTIKAEATVGVGAFERSGIKDVTIGKDAKLGIGAFSDCQKLTTVNMPTDGTVALSELCFAGDILLATIDLTKVGETIPYGAFIGCVALTSADLTGVKTIGAFAFADCEKLATVNTSTVERIGAYAFSLYQMAKNDDGETVYTGYAPAITSIDLSNLKEEEVEEGLMLGMGEGAFMYCDKLTSVTLPEGITTIAPLAFMGCDKLTTVNLPASVKLIGTRAFYLCPTLKTIDLSKVETIGAYAFAAALTQQQAPNGQTTTVPTPTALTDINLSSAKLIGVGAFYYTSIGGQIVAPNLTQLGDAAFMGSKITAFTAANLKHIGYFAFGDTALKSFTFSTAVEHIGERAFFGCSNLTTFYYDGTKTEGEINSYARLIGGNLYTVMQSGKLQLLAIPAGATAAELVVAEGTYKIAEYAGSMNPNLTSIVFPDSLRLIGEYAFAGCEKLAKVEFKSSTAPTLENYSEGGIFFNPATGALSSDPSAPAAPGYSILHSQFALFTNFGELYYFNFVTLAGAAEPIKMILPANSELSGYGALVYQAIFGKEADAERSEYIAMEANLVDFIEYAEKIAAIEKITAKDEKIVNKAVILYNALKQSGTSYGYTDEEWNALVKSVTDAKTAIFNIKIANSSLAVRQLQAKLNTLPTVYTDDLYELMTSIGKEIAALDRQERAVLDQSNYNALVASYNAQQKPVDPTDPVDPNTPVNPDKPKGSNLGLIIGLSVGGAVVVAGAVVAVLLILRKKKAQAGAEESAAAETAAETAATDEKATEAKSDEKPEEPATDKKSDGGADEKADDGATTADEKPDGTEASDEDKKD